MDTMTKVITDLDSITYSSIYFQAMFLLINLYTEATSSTSGGIPVPALGHIHPLSYPYTPYNQSNIHEFNAAYRLIFSPFIRICQFVLGSEEPLICLTLPTIGLLDAIELEIS